MWNTLTSPKLQTTNIVEKESNGEESDETCNMVQGNDSLKVTSESHLDDCASSSNDHDSMKAQVLNEELFIFYENLLSKYKLLKSKSFDLKEQNKVLFSKLDLILKEKVEISSERDYLKTQLDLISKENEISKNLILMLFEEL